MAAVATKLSWRNWCIPLSSGRLTLGEGYASLQALGAKPQEIPLMVQLVENPRFAVSNFDFFPGRVNLHMHDLIHIVLGRGLLAEDEAFVIGYTMGSTHRITTTEERLFSFVSKHLYPNVYRFNDDHIRIFRDATKLAYINAPRPLNEVDFDAYMDTPLDTVRDKLQIDRDLLRAYYRIEQNRYPHLKGSQRLLS